MGDLEAVALAKQREHCASAAMAGQQGSLGYELLNYFNAYFVYVWLIAESFIFLYKGLHLPYPQSVIAGEVVMAFFVVCIDRMRIFLGSMGNKTEQLVPIIGSMILGAFAVVGYCYFVALQIYVLRLEVIINAIALSFAALSFLSSIGMVVKFSRNRIA